MEKRPIVVIGALNSEIKYLVEMLESCDIETRSIYKFYKGYIKDYPVVIAKSEVGLVNASACLTLAIENYNPICIVNAGTAGGIIENRHKKDIIIADECFNIISSKTPYKELGEGSNSCDWDFMTFTDGGKDEKKIYKSDENLKNIALSQKDRYEHGNIYTGVVGSADIWNREKDKLKYLAEKHNVSCEDMELVAVYTIAQNYNIPAIGIKIMSDNELLGEEYEPAVGQYVQEYTYEVLKELVDRIEIFN